MESNIFLIVMQFLHNVGMQNLDLSTEILASLLTRLLHNHSPLSTVVFITVINKRSVSKLHATVSTYMSSTSKRNAMLSILEMLGLVIW